MNNYFIGGTGGSGGPGYGNALGGSGGNGMGASLNCDFHGDVVMNNAYHQGERGIYILDRAAALGAMYDSAESYPQPRCHPETRTKMLDDLREWALATNPETTILWLYGPAGAGKSAIMQTLAGQLRDAGRLGGCFFSKRGDAMRGDGKAVFATIAYQLALNVPWLRTPIAQVVEKNPSVVAPSIETQMQKLISEPCHAHRGGAPVTIIIDGLDECEGHGIQAEILRAIRNSSSYYIVPLRFIVASRPEPHIREVFVSPFYFGHYRSVNVEQSFYDVVKYLCDEFARIHREHHTMTNIPLPWPSPDVVRELVRKSSGHFIYASTIIKFIDDKNYRPTQRLAVVQDPNSSRSESPFDTLDQLYMTILRVSPRQSQLIPILCAIVHFELAACEIDQLLGLSDGETRLLLRGLHSVLDVPSYKTAITSHHASFLDFLSNPDRSGNFCAGTLNCRITLARSVLQFCAGPFQHTDLLLLTHLIRLIVSLPPSGAVAELIPLIGSINPDYIFRGAEYRSRYDYFGAIVSWLKNTPLAPADVIQLWEDYAFMFFIAKTDGRTNIPSVHHIVSPSPDVLHILVCMGLLQWGLSELPTKLDLTWTDLRTTLCSLRPKFVRDEHVLPAHRPQPAYPWAARDLALQLIRKMVKNHFDTDGGINPSASRDAYTRSQYDFGCDISLLVRLSLPCRALYRELWSIPPSEIWSSRPSGNTLIHHVSRWLKSFPDSTMELITFWQQAVPDPKLRRMTIFNLHTGDEEEGLWIRVKGYNDRIVRLHLPDSLKFVL